MKKKFVWVCIGLCFLIHLCVPICMQNVSASAESESSKAEELVGESVVELIGELDLQALQKYVDSLGTLSATRSYWRKKTLQVGTLPRTIPRRLPPSTLTARDIRVAFVAAYATRFQTFFQNIR